jgi:phosphatidylglycerophosphatase C
LPAEARGVALFDLDGTLTHRDTLAMFLTGYLKRHPARLPRAAQIAPALFGYLLDRDRGCLKSRAIRAVMGGDPRELIARWAQAFVTDLKPRGAFRTEALAVLEAHRRAGDHLVLLSASPDLYVPLIGRLLGFERTVCTEILWDADRLNGALRTPNRHGMEKVRCLERLRLDYAAAPITAYGNSLSDIPHLALAEHALLVNGNAAARRGAARAGIATGEWP